MNRSYLVTGGTGFLGSALVRRLVATGSRVRVLDNDSRGRVTRLRDLDRQFEFVDGDVRDADVVARACQDVDVVCHLACVNGTEFFYAKPDLVLDVAVRGMVNVIDAARRHHVEELLLVSSSEVYHDPPRVPTDEGAPLSIPDVLNPRYSYAAGKLISEVMAVNFGRRYFRRVTIVRPHNVYGNDMGTEHVIPQFAVRMKALQSHPTDPVPFAIQGSGGQTRSFVFIDDFIDGIVIVLDRGAHLGIYHIGTAEEVSIESLARQIAACFGRAIEIIPGPPADGGALRRCPDITRMMQLGYRPHVMLRDALPGVVRWYAEHVETGLVEQRA
jgi:nucleoside-diphosphate-sugar epimerase